MSKKKVFPKVEVESRAQLRAWLTSNHERTESVWLVSYKKAAGKRYLPYDAIVEEALCFGWIDSLPRKLDEMRSMLLLSPRKPGSAWSKANKERVERMIVAGLMTPAGLRKVDTAKQDGAWDMLNDVVAMVVPNDLTDALEATPSAQQCFDAFPPSSKRAILEWIKQAKRPETRARRINETARLAAKNIRANHYRQ